MKRTPEEFRREDLHFLWVLNVVYLLTTTLEPSDWGQKIGSEQMKTEDEKDSQQTRKKTLSSGSKMLFIFDATSEESQLYQNIKSKLFTQILLLRYHAKYAKTVEKLICKVFIN